MIESALPEIRRCVLQAADSLLLDGTHREMTLRVLSRPGYVLDADSPCRSATLVLGVFRALTGSVTPAAILAATAVELQMEAAYVFDDVADDEIDPREGLDAAEQLALALGLLTWGSALMARAVTHGSAPAHASAALTRFHGCFLVACGGQFVDAHLQRGAGVTERQALEMTAFKAGYLGMFAGGVAARLATGTQEAIRAADGFGFNLFTHAQIRDDLRDACPSGEGRGDIDSKKKTVPAVLFDSATRSRVSLCAVETRQAYEASDARACGEILAEVFLNRARRCLLELERLRYGTRDLERFLESFDPESDRLASS